MKNNQNNVLIQYQVQCADCGRLLKAFDDNAVLTVDNEIIGEGWIKSDYGWLCQTCAANERRKNEKRF